MSDKLLRIMTICSALGLAAVGGWLSFTDPRPWRVAFAVFATVNAFIVYHNIAHWRDPL